MTYITKIKRMLKRLYKNSTLHIFNVLIYNFVKRSNTVQPSLFLPKFPSCMTATQPTGRITKRLRHKTTCRSLFPLLYCFIIP